MTSERVARPAFAGFRNRSSVMNSIIYIVGLVVVVAIVLSLIGVL